MSNKEKQYIFTREVKRWGVEAGDYYNPKYHDIVGGAEKLLADGVIEEEIYETVSNKEKLRDLISEGCGEFVRKPRLEHLLMAIGKNNGSIEYKEIEGITTKGEFILSHLCEDSDSFSSNIFIDLTKPPLEQSEEVISKLIEILS